MTNYFKIIIYSWITIKSPQGFFLTGGGSISSPRGRIRGRGNYILTKISKVDVSWMLFEKICTKYFWSIQNFLIFLIVFSNQAMCTFCVRNRETDTDPVDFFLLVLIKIQPSAGKKLFLKNRTTEKALLFLNLKWE